MGYRILTFDGGGIRGLMSALLIQRLQADVMNATKSSTRPQGLNFLENVSLFAGTSTGSFMALALAQSGSAASVSNLVDLYKTQGPNIFKPFRPLLSHEHMPAAFAERVATHGLFGDPGRLWAELWHVRYDNTPLKAVLQKMFGASATLASLPASVLVNTLRLWNGQSWAPASISNLPGSSTGEMLMVDAALSSGAAPTYFPPYNNPLLGACADGGLFANNPSMTAMTSALAGGNALKDIVLLSIGTGLVAEGIPSVGTPTDWGIVKWMDPSASAPRPAMPLFASLMDTVSRETDAQCAQLLGASYARLNPVLTDTVALDDYSPQALAAMQKAVDAFVNNAGWQATVSWAAHAFA